MDNDLTYNVPADAEMDAPQTWSGGGDSGGKGGENKFLRMRPAKQQPETEDNRILLTLFRPARMRAFEGVVPMPTATWHVPVPGHYINGTDASGNQTSEFVLCKKEANAYYQKAYKSFLVYEPTVCAKCNISGQFTVCLACGTNLVAQAASAGMVRNADNRCPQCDEAKRMWEAWRGEWAALGFSEAERRKLKNSNFNQYKEYSASNTAIKGFQDSAGDNTHKVRHLMALLDVDKLLGTRKLSEGEDPEVKVQLTFPGKTVFELLQAKHRANKIFFEPRNKLCIILTRDTSAGVKYSKYTAEDSTIPDIPDAWVEYLRSGDAIPDVSDDLVVLSYEEHSKRAGLTLTSEDFAPERTVDAPAATQRALPPPPPVRPSGPVSVPVTAGPKAPPSPAPVVSTTPPPPPPPGPSSAPVSTPTPVVTSPPAPASPPVLPPRTGMPTPSDGQRPRRSW